MKDRKLEGGCRRSSQKELADSVRILLGGSRHALVRLAGQRFDALVGQAPRREPR